MATTAGINIHVDPSEIEHKYRPADDDRAGYGTLVLGRPGYSAYANVFFEDIAAIDTAIAELVALKQEMDPPVTGATPDERLLLAVHGVSPDNPANVRELRTHEAECTLTDHTPCLAHLAGQTASVAS